MHKASTAKVYKYQRNKRGNTINIVILSIEVITKRQSANRQIKDHGCKLANNIVKDRKTLIILHFHLNFKVMFLITILSIFHVVTCDL